MMTKICAWKAGQREDAALEGLPEQLLARERGVEELAHGLDAEQAPGIQGQATRKLQRAVLRHPRPNRTSSQRPKIDIFPGEVRRGETLIPIRCFS